MLPLTNEKQGAVLPLTNERQGAVLPATNERQGAGQRCRRPTRSRVRRNAGLGELLLPQRDDDRSADALHSQLVGWEPGMDTARAERC